MAYIHCRGQEVLRKESTFYNIRRGNIHKAFSCSSCSIKGGFLQVDVGGISNWSSDILAALGCIH